MKQLCEIAGMSEHRTNPQQHKRPVHMYHILLWILDMAYYNIVLFPDVHRREEERLLAFLCMALLPMECCGCSCKLYIINGRCVLASFPGFIASR